MVVDGVFKQAEKILYRLLKVLSRALRFTFHQLYEKPAEIKGHVWTWRLWLLVLGVLYLAVIIIREAAWFIVIAAVLWLVLGQLQRMKPKKKHRPLPYRRHRRH